ncbi:MAG: hypothetical protein L0Z62_11080 [Gemmataceae bacterium]|nr:hypothetical protein [Gemmataceae bacterium]
MRRTLIAVALLLVGGFALIELSGVSLWVGGYDLQVNLRSAGQIPIEAVRCEVLNTPEEITAEPQLKQLFEAGTLWERPLERSRWPIDLRPFDGRPFSVHIRNGGRVSVLLGRDRGYSQQRGLAVVVEYRDGKRIGKVFEIPDGPVTREVTVTVP